MQSAHSILFVLHIILGSMALILFWLPIASKKGSLDHKKFGQYYGFVMYAVAASGALMATLVLIAPVTIKGNFLAENTDTSEFSAQIRIFWSFLLYLSLLTYVSVRQGFAVLENKTSQAPLRRAKHIAPLLALILGGMGMVALGWANGQTLHMVFGALGSVVGTGMLRYSLKQDVTSSDRVKEHLGAMIGSGIGAYTAFIAFGGRQLFSSLGELQLIFWIAPSILGAILIAYWSRDLKPKTHRS